LFELAAQDALKTLLVDEPDMNESKEDEIPSIQVI